MTGEERGYGDDKCRCGIPRRYHDMPEAGRDHPFRSLIIECSADETQVLATDLHEGIRSGDISVDDLAKVLRLAGSTVTEEPYCIEGHPEYVKGCSNCDWKAGVR